MLSRCLLTFFLSLGFSVGLLENLSAQEKPVEAQRPVTNSEVNAEVTAEAAQLIKQLQSSNFKERTSATKSLMQLGVPAIGAVATASESSDMEVSSRCLEILHHFFKSEDEKVKAAATAALEKLAKSENKVVAQRAESLIKKPEIPQVAGNRIFVRGIGGGGVIQLQVNGRVIKAQGGQQIQIKNVNGQRTIDVSNNDGKIHIEDNNGRDIQMKVTETVNGKEKTTEYKAKDLDDLKKKHPDAAKIFEKYTKGNKIQPFRVIRRIQAQAIPLPAVQPLPNIPGIKPAARRAIPQQVPQNLPNAKDLEKAREKMQSAIQKLQDYTSNANGKIDRDELKKLTDNIKDAQQDLMKAMRTQVQRQLPAPIERELEPEEEN